MRDIDFLPAQYRERRYRRRSQPWQLVVVAMFAALLAGAAWSQSARYRAAENRLAELTPQHDRIVAQNAQLAEIRKRIQQAQLAAELYTYLHHPWLRTRLLAMVLTPIPQEVVLEQLQILQEARREPTRPGQRRSAASDETGASDELSPAARDLALLREKYDRLDTVILLAGTTTTSAPLHGYVAQLESADLVAKAELESIEIAGDRPDAPLAFRVRLIVRPGYDQPDGPQGPPASTVAGSPMP